MRIGAGFLYRQYAKVRAVLETFSLKWLGRKGGRILDKAIGSR